MTWYFYKVIQRFFIICIVPIFTFYNVYICTSICFVSPWQFWLLMGPFGSLRGDICIPFWPPMGRFPSSLAPFWTPDGTIWSPSGRICMHLMVFCCDFAKHSLLRHFQCCFADAFPGQRLSPALVTFNGHVSFERTGSSSSTLLHLNFHVCFGVDLFVHVASPVLQVTPG